MTPPPPSSKDATPSDGAEAGAAAPAKKPSPLKNSKVRLGLIAAGIVLLILFVLWFFHYWTRGRFVQETNDAYQPLVRLNPVDFAVNVAKAAAQEDQARASIDQARAQIHQQEASIAQSQAQLVGARAQARTWRLCGARASRSRSIRRRSSRLKRR